MWQGTRAILEGESDYEICGEAATGREAAERLATLQPDLAILDVSMPELNGLEAARQIVRRAPRYQILILTMHESDDVLEEALAIGVHGFFVESDAARELVAAIAELVRFAIGNKIAQA